MPPTSAFDIYQTEAGYVAVTSDVRRAILTALAERERRLPELAELTEKSKATLSSLHVRELLDQKLIEEVPDPKDARTKWYRLIGAKIGSSDVPVEALRDAVKKYVTASPMAARVALVAVVEALTVGAASDQVLRLQAGKLGSHCAAFVTGATAAEKVGSFAKLLEREGILRDVTVEGAEFSGRSALPSKETPPERVAVVIEALLESAAAAGGSKLVVKATATGKRVSLNAT